MNLTLTIDFGSTYTRLAAFDLEKAELVGTAQSEITVNSDAIGVGGILACGRDPGGILKFTSYKSFYPKFLCPVSPVFVADKNYILFAAGLLSEVAPLPDFKIIKKYLVKI